MMKNMNRRRVRKRPRRVKKTKMKFASVLVIMILAIALGYGTAKFVIGPILGFDTDESSINIVQKEESEANADKEAEEDEKESTKEESQEKDTLEGFALQFGVFSTKDGAQKLVASLKEKGVEAEIIEEDNQYKVISPIIKTRDEALGKLNDIKDKNIEDVFIASF